MFLKYKFSKVKCQYWVFPRNFTFCFAVHWVSGSVYRYRCVYIIFLTSPPLGKVKALVGRSKEMSTLSTSLPHTDGA